jgi:GNAT superfamily N-acetyltransferase
MLGKSANGLFGLMLYFRFPRRSQWVNATPARPVYLQESSRLQSLASIDSKEHYPFEATLHIGCLAEGLTEKPDLSSFDIRSPLSLCVAVPRTLADPADLVFGLFDAGHLIGITAVFRSREDPSGETALLGMSFIAPEYRGRGLSRLLYKARLEWIRTKGLFKRVVVSHRASNGASRRAIERHGFLPTRCAARIWPDGITEDEIFYEMRISN